MSRKWQEDSIAIQPIPAQTLGLPPSFWIISDTHFGHHTIEGYCGRPSSAEQCMIEQWRHVVAPGAPIVHLGDLTLSHSEPMRELIADLPGTKYLLRGNHDTRSVTHYRLLAACRRESDEPHCRASANHGRHEDGANGPLTAPENGCSAPKTGLSDRLLGFTLIPPFSITVDDWTVSFTHAPHDELIALPKHINVHGHIHEKLMSSLLWLNVSVEWTDYAPVRSDLLLAKRIQLLMARQTAECTVPLSYAEWLAHEFGGEVLPADTARFGSEDECAQARAAYTAYRRALAAAHQYAPHCERPEAWEHH